MWFSAEEADPIKCDRVLVAVGRVANTQGAGTRNSRSGDRPSRVRSPSVRTFRVHRAGRLRDWRLHPRPQAGPQSIARGDRVRGSDDTSGHGHVNYDTVPGVVYTHPELASVGSPKNSCNKKNVSTAKACSPFKPADGHNHWARPRARSKCWPTPTRTASWASTFSARGPAT